MRGSWGALVLIAAVTGVAGGQQATVHELLPAASLEAQSSTARTLLDLEDGWAKALVRRDVAYFRRMLAPGFVYTEDAAVMTADDVIKGATGPDRVEFAGNEGMKVHDFGNTAVVTGILVVRGRGKDGAFNHRYRFTDTWQKRGGRWQIIAAQDYLIPKEPMIADRRLQTSHVVMRCCFVAVGVVVLTTACTRGAERATPTADTARAPTAAVTVAGTRIESPHAGPPGEWQMPAGDYSSSRYSTLNTITAANVGGMHASWAFSTGVLRGHEGQPLVIGNTMYVITPYPNVAYAIDLTQPGQPLKWKFRPENAQQAVGRACCDIVNRGAAYADGKIFYNLLDGHTVAVDVATGRQVWRTEMGNLARGETITMAPIVVKNKVIVGSSGGEMGVRGWIAALDVATGKEVWRAYNIGPDKDVKVGPRFKPFYAHDKGKDLGSTTWPGDTWKTGGGTVWGWLSYDPELNLIYHGTSNPGPWNSDQRRGDNKWTASILARDADTGEMVWALQTTPHDLWDYDAVNENILVDLPIKGVTRKALVHFDRNGFAYTVDRATGEVILASPFVPMNWSTGIDLETGRPQMVTEKMTSQGKKVMDICPSLEGGKNQQPAAFSPQTGLFYVPTNNLCMDFESHAVTYIAGTPFIGALAPEKGGPGGYRGEFIAWDATTGKKIWGIKEPYPVWGGALVTAGGVVFYGTLDGWFKAADARTGKVLWQFKVGSGVVGNPVTYTGPDGKQYVAIYAGVGGDMGLLIAGDVAANLPYDVRERGTTLPDLARWTSWGGELFVFSL